MRVFCGLLRKFFPLTFGEILKNLSNVDRQYQHRNPKPESLEIGRYDQGRADSNGQRDQQAEAVVGALPPQLRAVRRRHQHRLQAGVRDDGNGLRDLWR